MPTRLWDKPALPSIVSNTPFITRNLITGDDATITYGDLLAKIIGETSFSDAVSDIISGATIARNKVSGLNDTDSPAFAGMTLNGVLTIDNIDSGNLGALRVRTDADGGISNWVAIYAGGSYADSQPGVVIGDFNGYPTIGGHRHDLLGWRTLVINGDWSEINSGGEVWIPNTIKNSRIEAFPGSPAIQLVSPILFLSTAKISAVPEANDDVVNKLYADSLIQNELPSWFSFLSENPQPTVNVDNYAKITNSYNFECTQGYLIYTGVYDNPALGFTRAPWGFLLHQTNVNDFDAAGIGQKGVGLYLKTFRRDQVALGLSAEFEPRGVHPDGPLIGEDRNDLRALIDKNCMIKGIRPELYFNNTDQAGQGVQNFGLRLRTEGVTVVNYDPNWDNEAFIAVFNISGVSYNTNIFAHGGVTLFSTTFNEQGGTMRYSGGNVEVYNGTTWIALAYA